MTRTFLHCVVAVAGLTACGRAPNTDAGPCAGMAGGCKEDLPPITLSGCADTHYTAEVTLGGNQTFNLAIDSGSTTLGVASAACSNCGVSPLYSPGTSAHDTGSPVTANYYDGSAGWQGEIYTDTVGFDDMAPVPLAFGAITTQTAFFAPSVQCAGVTQPLSAQGILGIGRTAAALPGTDSFVDTLRKQGRSSTVTVALDDLGGTLWVGGYDPAAVDRAPHFVPLWRPPANASPAAAAQAAALYIVQVSALALADAPSTPATENLVMAVDTGTPGIMLQEAAYRSLSASLTTHAGYLANFSASFLSSGVCMPANQATTPAELDAALPRLNVVLADAKGEATTLALPATASYLQLGVSVDGQHPYYCSTLKHSDVQVGLFGAAVMRSLVVTFDPEGKQVGFAPRAGAHANSSP